MMRRLAFKTAIVLGFCLLISCKAEKPTPIKAAKSEVAADDANSTHSYVVGKAAGDEKTFSFVAMEYCWCPPGKFTMADRPGILEPVEVTWAQGFWLGKYEVTQEQYERVMEANPSHSKGKQLPVEEVTWRDAVKFCRKLTEIERTAGRLPNNWEYKIPTEAQWECLSGRYKHGLLFR